MLSQYHHLDHRGEEGKGISTIVEHRPNTIHVHARMEAASSDTITFRGGENSERTTLRDDCIVFNVLEQYTIVSTRLRYAAILYGNGAGPK